LENKNLRPTEESQFKLEHPEENGAAAGCRLRSKCFDHVSAILRNVKRRSFFLCLENKNLRPTEEPQFKSEHPEENGAAAGCRLRSKCFDHVSAISRNIERYSFFLAWIICFFPENQGFPKKMLCSGTFL